VAGFLRHQIRQTAYGARPCFRADYSGLQLTLSPAEAKKLKPQAPINPNAYEYYLRGVDLYSLNDFVAAITMLEKSTSIEPGYAPTWAYLGRAYATNASLQFGGHEHYAGHRRHLKSNALDPALVAPQVYMANLLTDTGRVEQSVPLLREAIQTVQQCRSALGARIRLSLWRYAAASSHGIGTGAET